MDGSARSRVLPDWVGLNAPDWTIPRHLLPQQWDKFADASTCCNNQSSALAVTAPAARRTHRPAPW